MASLEDRLIELELDYDTDLSHIAADPCCEVCDDELIAEIKFKLEERMKEELASGISKTQC